MQHNPTVSDNNNNSYNANQIIETTTNKWITGLALVTFDIDEGQKLQRIVPANKISQDIEKQLIMLAFPDSNSFSDYENTFKYTFKLSNQLYGFTCFKQKKDPDNPRGYSQRSFVILSELPFVYFYEKLAEFIVFKVLNNPALETEQIQSIMNKIWEQSNQWPIPQAKQQIKVPVLDYQLEAQIPNYMPIKNKSFNFYTKKQHLHLDVQLREKNKQYSIQNIMSHQQLLRSGPFQEINLNDIFSTCQPALWALWECVMLNKSVVLFGYNPHQVSHAVLGSISLISPFQYKGNINPYITVYDPNLDQLAKQKNNWIMGACNPLFEKFFKRDITTLISLTPEFKCSKHLKHLQQFLTKNIVSQEQRVINESAIRKYFHQLSNAVMAIFNHHLNQQNNNLKFFNPQMFMKSLKDRKQYLGLEHVFSSKKYLYSFFEQFISSKNFQYFLREKNAVRVKKN